MDALDVSRWQFGITTVYHFIFVPLTIGLAPLIALMQTIWVATKNPAWYRMTRFFGKVFLINFAIGVATGIVQEFQFGMNWSEYSRFVGDVFGAPLAMEGLVAFFVESTFIGLWIFGWDRLPKWLHLASIWLVAIAVNLSAFFIITANSFMQHPVGTRYNPQTKRAELLSIWELFTNNTAIAAFWHAVVASLLVAATFVAAVSAWWMVRSKDQPDAKAIYRPAAVLGCWVAIIASFGLFLTGDVQGKLMFHQQPMKMAAAESLCHTETDPDFSILTVGTQNNCDNLTRVIEVPFVLPFLAEGKFDGVTLAGAKDLQTQYEQRFGPGWYIPNLFVTYWSFRAMIGLMALPFLFALSTLWLTRRGRVIEKNWFARVAVWTIPMPFLASSAGWVFTEMGRQPWVVVPNPDGDPLIRLTVREGVSVHGPGVVWVSLIGFTLTYAVLAVIWFYLIRRYVAAGPHPHDSEPKPPVPPSDDEVAPLSFAY
jgi:cytochrome d ubiquinol oxidase subunit I